MKKNIKSVHMIGICGVAMGSLAGMLAQLGCRVTGSDEHIYPPMSDKLLEWGIPTYEGFSAGNVGHPDLVIIGNAVGRGNVEVEHVLNARLPYASMTSALREFFLWDREVIAVAGTHGKTTTTALLAHILETAGLSPSFLVGGVPLDYGSNFKLGSGRYFVIEGDEYDSAFFEKVPKFILYRPQHLILTSLEFDHADIYSDLEEIRRWFGRGVNIVPSNGIVISCRDYASLGRVVEGCRSISKTYGREDADFTWKVKNFDGDYTCLTVTTDNGPIELRTRLFGGFNYANITAAASAALLLGADPSDVIRAVESFSGVRRRQECLYRDDSLIIYEDFAHHPTAISEVLRSMRSRFPDAVLWALYEPRSATSRRNTFQNELPGAFSAADRIIIKEPYRMESIPETERIDIKSVVDELHRRGCDALLQGTADEIVQTVFSGMDRRRLNVVVAMSNGAFDGIYEKLVEYART